MMQKCIKFALCLFPQVVQKHSLGEMGSESTVLNQYTCGTIQPKIIKIGQCLSKLLSAVEGLSFLLRGRY